MTRIDTPTWVQIVYYVGAFFSAWILWRHRRRLVDQGPTRVGSVTGCDVVLFGVLLWPAFWLGMLLAISSRALRR